MQNIGAHSMDRDLLMSRRKMQETISQCLLRKQSSPYKDLVQKLPDIARKLEEIIFKDTASKEDYMSMTVANVEQKLQAILRRIQQLSHHISTSSAISTMMPTPGMLHSGSSLNPVVSMDNSMINTSGASMVAKATKTGSLLPTADGSVGVANMISPLNSLNGSNPGGYGQSPVNVSHGSGGNGRMLSTGISQELSQMILTPGLNNPQLMSVNSDFSYGGSIQGKIFLKSAGNNKQNIFWIKNPMVNKIHRVI